MAAIEINDDWTPTSDNINALPQPLQDYIHKLTTHMDPAYTLQRLRAAEDRVAELEAIVVVGKVFGR